MSKDNASRFLDDLEQDSSFRTAFVKLSTVEERAEYLKGRGLTFSKEDMHAAMQGRREVTLDVKEMRAITGGIENLGSADMERIALMHVYGVFKRSS